MRNLVLCALLLTIVLSVEGTLRPWPSCLSLLCRDQGEACYPTRNIYCKDGYYCQQVGKFPEEHGVCVEALRTGDDCSGSNFNYCDKLLDLKCVTVNKTAPRTQRCHVRGFKTPGEGCAADYQCFGGAEGACEKPAYDCKGLPAGSECYNSAECLVNQICNSKSECADVTPLGGDCTQDSDECGMWDNQCTPKTAGNAVGSCKKIHTQKEGELCYNDKNCDQERFRCKKASDTDATGVCTKLNPPSNKTCTVHANCTENFEECSCNMVTGEATCSYDVPIYGFSKIVEDAFACARENDCKTLSYYPTSCTFIYCRKSFGCYESAIREMALQQEPNPCYRAPDKFDEVHYSTCVAPPAEPKPAPEENKVSAAIALFGNGLVLMSIVVIGVVFGL